MARYDAGETLSSIARTYNCSPPAISYVVSRSRARGSAGAVPPQAAAAEPQLVKSPSAEPATIDLRAPQPSPEALLPSQPAGIEFPVKPRLVPERAAEPPNGNWRRESNGSSPNFAALRTASPAGVPAHSAQANGDHRQRLHLSLGNGSQSGTGGPPPADSHPAQRQSQTAYQPDPEHHDRGNGFVQHPAAPPSRGADRVELRPPTAGLGNYSDANYPHSRTGNGDDRAVGGRGGASFIDRELRARVDEDIATFLAAFDAALAHDTQESRTSLREATDRLLRAGARTRIELERMEARLPLPRQESARRVDTGWQQR